MNLDRLRLTATQAVAELRAGTVSRTGLLEASTFNDVRGDPPRGEATVLAVAALIEQQLGLDALPIDPRGPGEPMEVSRKPVMCASG